MPMKWYVATLARYVIVEAASEDEAREKGQSALYDLYADLRRELGNDTPIRIRTVRLAEPDEVALISYHAANSASA